MLYIFGLYHMEKGDLHPHTIGLPLGFNLVVKSLEVC
jgi:hypothetical protein